MNRAKYLEDTLASLGKQTFKDFEIILVNGPSTDNTEEVVKKFDLKYFHTDKANICISRNIGVKNSDGELISFIDDDAIPDKNWLKDIVDYYNKYKSDKIGAIGGTVFNFDGSELQFKHGYIGIWGEVNQISDFDKNYNSPKGYYFNTVIGVNSTFQKDALLSIGAFDEEIEYQHDESDVCIRLIKAGYKVIGIENAVVFHKFAPSAIRDDNKKFKDWNSIAKNSVYFAIKNSADYAPILLRLTKPLTLEFNKFKKIKEQNLGFFKTIGKDISLFFSILKGYFRGLFQKRKLLKV